MTACRIVFHHSSISSHGTVGINSFGHGTWITTAICETHGIQMPGPGPITTDALCPIGRIERASDDAIARIKAETGLFGPGTR